MQALLNVVRREVARYMTRFAFPVAGLVSSYDPATHSVKVQYQPEGTLSGWIPLNAVGVGAGFGVFVGPHIGHALLIGFQEGEREAPFVIGRIATDVETPVSVAEGEIVAKHESGASLSLLKDGSVTLTDKAGALIKMDGTGTVSVSALAGQPLTLSANGSSLLIDGTGNMTLTLAAGKAMQVSGAGGAGVSIDGLGNCLVNGTSVLLGGASGTKKVVLDGDPVSGGFVHSSATLTFAK